MKKLIFPVFLLLFTLLSKVNTAQSTTFVADTADYPYWIAMMQDPDANFFAVQSAFNKYWAHHTITRGCGWKPFKRWESWMKMRVTPDGRMPAPDAVMLAYNKFVADHDNSTSFSGNWTNQGPFNLPAKGYEGLGRINAIAFHPTDENVVYIGAPAGGMWFTTDGGASWTTTTDGLPTLGVSAIAVDPVNPSTIYIGTGDRDATDAPGLGVMKSTDNGATWQLINTGMGNRIVGDLLIDPTNPQIIYAGATTGFFKSIDGGANWEQKPAGSLKDIAFKPGNPNVIYGSQTGSFSRSTDGGETWTTITAGLPAASRGVIAVTPANPELVYLLLSQGDNGFRGLYRSTDSGLTFTEMSDSPNIMDWSCDGSGSGGQAWYDLALVADPVNPNTIYAGGVNIWKSTDGGLSWEISGHWYGGCGVPAVHADQHIFTFNPLNNRIYAGNDGGIYYTANGGSTWPEISNGLAISQAYKIGQSATVDDMVVNGYQDNGTSVQEDDVWTAIGGGDGMECIIDQTDEWYKYTSVYYGAINRVKGYNASQIAGNGINGITEEGDWVTPYILDENDPNTMFIGYKNVWRSENVKTNNPSSVKWKKISTINTGNLNVLEQSPVNTNLLYASSGNLFYRCDNVKAENPVWSNLTSRLPSVSAISDIECSPFDENTLYVILDKKVFKSIDKGLTWTEITGSLPSIHFSTIAYYKNSQEGLYIGSDAGVYYKDQSLSDWIPFSDGLPAAIKVTELEIYYDPVSPEGDRIKAGTYGRGLWKSDMYSTAPVADFTANPLVVPTGCGVNFKDKSFGVPFNWQWNFQGADQVSSTESSPQGITYSTPGTFDVSLTVSNTSGSNSITKNHLIVVSDTLKPLTGFMCSTQAFCDLTQVVKFTDTTKFCPIAWNWAITPNTYTYVNGTSAQSQHPEVVFNATGSYTVTLIAQNVNGSRSAVKEDFIQAGGYVMPFAEDFESGTFSSKGWTVENPDNEITWGITDVAGSTPGTKAVWMNFFNYQATGGRRDRLVSPAFNFGGNGSMFLTFNHAYATRYNSMSDSLIIYISDDCGSTWQRVFGAGEKGQGTFATFPKTTTFFSPAGADEWCGGTWGSKCYTIDLSAWANKPNIKLAFESYNKIGNNLYIDNVKVTPTVGTTILTTALPRINLFPNPSRGFVTLSTHDIHGDISVVFYNQLGSQVYNIALNADQVQNKTIDLSALPKGMYSVKITGNGLQEQQKIVLQ